MSALPKILGQLRPADTNAASIYSPAAGTIGIISTIIVCNTTGSTAAYSIFLDDDGTTYDESTALYFGVNLAANTSDKIQTYIPMDDSSGNIAVKTGTSSALTFSVFGTEFK